MTEWLNELNWTACLQSFYSLCISIAPSGLPSGSAVKNLPTMWELQETWVWSLHQEDPLEEDTAIHSSILAWRIPWTEEPGRWWSIGSPRDRHNWSDFVQHIAPRDNNDIHQSSDGMEVTIPSLLLLSHFSHVRLCATPQMAAHQAPHPWDSPGKNTGVGCHFLLQCFCELQAYLYCHYWAFTMHQEQCIKDADQPKRNQSTADVTRLSQTYSSVFLSSKAGITGTSCHKTTYDPNHLVLFSLPREMDSIAWLLITQKNTGRENSTEVPKPWASKALMIRIYSTGSSISCSILSGYQNSVLSTSLSWTPNCYKSHFLIPLSFSISYWWDNVGRFIYFTNIYWTLPFPRHYSRHCGKNKQNSHDICILVENGRQQANKYMVFLVTKGLRSRSR